MMFLENVTWQMGNLALLSKKVKMNPFMGKAQADNSQNRIIASNFCKLIDNGVKSLCLQCRTESCDGMADIACYTRISDVIWF